MIMFFGVDLQKFAQGKISHIKSAITKTFAYLLISKIGRGGVKGVVTPTKKA
jgi:hypothetical protein